MEGEMRMSTVLTCMGESLIDLVPLHAPRQSERAFGTGESKPEVQAEVLPKGAMSTNFRRYPGGSIFNVAVGLARLGQHAAFAGKIAEDFLGIICC
jgi:sugar/nucleoside kinase (ribokinase family)